MMGVKGDLQPAAALPVAAVLLAFWLGAGVLLAQEGAAEGAIPTPTSGAAATTIDPQSLMPTLYMLVAGVAAAAVAVTILLALGMGDVSKKKRLAQGEKELVRMLGESESEFQEGRRQGELPTQTT